MTTAAPPADLHADLREFFRRMEPREDADPIAGAELFQETFLSLDPAGVTMVTRDQLRAVLPMREQLFRSAGVRDNRLRHLEPKVLDERHVLAETTWELGGQGAEQEPLRLRSTYLLRREEGGWQVVAYLNHQDLGAVLAARRAG